MDLNPLMSGPGVPTTRARDKEEGEGGMDDEIGSDVDLLTMK
eukprot:gene12035-15137_t